MKLPYLMILLIFPFLFGCKNEKTHNSEKEQIIKPKYGKVFFEYDQIDYYQSDIQESRIEELFNNKNKSKVDKYKYTVPFDETPETITDLDFLNYMKEIGFKKRQINKSRFNEINKIFIEKTPSDGYTAACVPVFRDILVFRKKQKVTGIAKICFGCHQYLIIGTDASTENFGTNTDYDHLGNLLDHL